MSCSSAQCSAAACDAKTCFPKNSTVKLVLHPELKEIKQEDFCSYKNYIKLFYFDGRGRGEVSRLMAAYGNLPYLDVRISQDEWKASDFWKSKMPFGQMPVMCAKGECLVAQSRAIEHYFAQYTGLAGRDPLEEAKIDQVVEATTDIMTPMMRIWYETKDEKEKMTKLDAHFKDEFPKWMTALEKLLAGDYFLGSRVTYADFAVFNLIDNLLMRFNRQKELAPYTKIMANHEKVGALPAVAAWIKARPVTPF